jgi:hypothetical protein
MHLWRTAITQVVEQDWHAIGFGHSLKKAIRYGTGKFKRRLVDCTGAMETPFR